MRARTPEDLSAPSGRPSLAHAHNHAPAGISMLAGLFTLIASLVLALSLTASTAGAQPDLPPGEAGAAQRLETSPRHGEYVMVDVPGRDGPVNTFVVYPERSEAAPVVIVIHEIYGMTDWIKSVADQLAADGFIALAPDLLTGKAPGGGGTADFPDRDAVVGAIRALPADEVVASLDAVRSYGIGLPASTDRSATVGYCWGGSTSFMYATRQPGLDAAVVYYGTSPEGMDAYRNIGAAVLGLYGGDDNRVNSTIPRAEKAMSELGKTYETHIYEGAGHGFLRAQDGRDGANMRATRRAWPETISFLREHLAGSGGMGMGGMSGRSGMSGMSGDSGMTPPYVAEVLADLETLEGKLTALAGALTQEQLGWRPMDGVRSASEVYMHVAATNYMLPRMLGHGFPEGVDWRNLESVTDKEEVVATLEASFDYVREVLKGLSASDLDRPTRIFGSDGTWRQVVSLVANHAHEHLGQSIAYARANRVAPPWSRGGM